jgi:hypothetical protein
VGGGGAADCLYSVVAVVACVVFPRWHHRMEGQAGRGRLELGLFVPIKKSTLLFVLVSQSTLLFDLVSGGCWQSCSTRRLRASSRRPSAAGRHAPICTGDGGCGTRQAPEEHRPVDLSILPLQTSGYA